MGKVIITCPFDKKECRPQTNPLGDLWVCSWYKFDGSTDPDPVTGLRPGRCMFLDLYDKLALLG